MSKYVPYLWVEMTGKPGIEQQIPEPFKICVLLHMRSSRAVLESLTQNDDLRS